MRAAHAYFLHIARNLRLQIRLGREGNDKRTILNQRDGSVLEFARGICLGMDIRNFLELESCFHRERVVQSASDEENMLHRKRATGKKLNLFFGVEYLLHRSGHAAHLLETIRHLLCRHRSALLRKIQCTEIHHDDLR